MKSQCLAFANFILIAMACSKSTSEPVPIETPVPTDVPEPQDDVPHDGINDGRRAWPYEGDDEKDDG